MTDPEILSVLTKEMDPGSALGLLIRTQNWLPLSTTPEHMVNFARAIIREAADRVVPEEQEWRRDLRGHEWNRWKERQQIRQRLLAEAQPPEES